MSGSAASNAGASPYLNGMNLHPVSIKPSPPWDLPASCSKYGKHMDRVALLVA